MNEGFVRGMTYGGEYSDDVMNSLQQLTQSVYFTSNQVRSDVGELSKKIEMDRKKSRKKVTSRQIMQLNSGEIGLLKTYDDNTKEVEPFILNIRGNFNVYRVEIYETSQECYYFIYFEKYAIRIVGRLDQLKKMRLFEQFVKAGVCFTPRISRNEIANILFESFAPIITNTKSKLTISSLAGWYNGRFQCRENFLFATAELVNCFPVYRKRLATETQNLSARDYFTKLKEMKSWNDRTMVMIFQVSSLLSSLLNEWGHPFGYILNFIETREERQKKIPVWFQIFNRDKGDTIKVDISEKKWKQLLRESKDEAVIIDFREGEGDSQYERNKRRQRMESVIESVSRGENVINTVITISNRWCASPMVYNIELSDFFITDDMTIEIVNIWINQFILFVEKNMERVKKIVIETSYDKYSALVCVMKIIQEFWLLHNVNVISAAEIPSHIDFVKLMQNGKTEVGNIIDKFRAVMRRGSASYFIYRKDDKIELPVSIRYDEDYVWIPAQILEECLEQAGLSYYKLQILTKLREESILRTDSQGFTRKLQIAGQRREFYQFNRKFFTRIGETDIVYLGKELENA